MRASFVNDIVAKLSRLVSYPSSFYNSNAQNPIANRSNIIMYPQTSASGYASAAHQVNHCVCFGWYERFKLFAHPKVMLEKMTHSIDIYFALLAPRPLLIVMSFDVYQPFPFVFQGCCAGVNQRSCHGAFQFHNILKVASVDWKSLIGNKHFVLESFRLKHRWSALMLPVSL